jgi:predicted nuclease of predicted toxin-antitoxin system
VILWIDAQLSPALASWIAEHFKIEAFSVKYLGYRDANDRQIFDRITRRSSRLRVRSMRASPRFKP